MSEERSELRHAVDIQGRYRTGNGLAKDVAVGDLSAHGCKFYDRFSNLGVGDYISIRIGSIGPIDAHVRWTRQFYAGVQFKSPLHPSVLAHMVPTIEDGMSLDGTMEQRNEGIEPAAKSDSSQDEKQYFDLTIRPPTWHDLRAVLDGSSKPLPISSYTDALDFFYRLLERLTGDAQVDEPGLDRDRDGKSNE